ncbi:zinc transporter 11 precursor [Hibiscus trionum]|uniref:Zinc transporter 11 n=1 Tax=Hibiscus trionum TaxID=183268 RepID=A0A9W7JA44_HIBTR|nr:zinc transporter 11 precursor [Hibiscus trionum]
MKVSSFLFFFFFFLSLSLLLSATSHGGNDDGNERHNLRSKSLVLVKIWCLILVFVGTFMGGMSPYFLKWNQGFLVIGTQFAGGVFLGTAMMHFLSDANETFQDLSPKKYPFAFMLACVGYLLTMAADSVVSYVYGKGNGSCRKTDSELQGTDTACEQSPSLTSVSSFGDSVMLIVALCFHSVFEGISIGIAETEFDAWKALWTISLHKIFAAIAMGIALLRMIPDRPLLSCIAYAFAFAVSSPVGVAIGIIIDATTEGAMADWIFAISMGLASGVFIYVSINHLLSKGYTSHKTVSVDKPLYKLLAVLLGVGVIAVVMIWDT